MTRLNYLVQRTDRGGAALRAMAALPVLTGSWREVGGGLQLTTPGAFDSIWHAAAARPAAPLTPRPSGEAGQHL